KADCIELLKLPEQSFETALLRGVADSVTRKRFKNRAMLLGQIGVETFPCPANCKFCVFGENHTQFPKTDMSVPAILESAKLFTEDKRLYALFLMFMHTFDKDKLFETIISARKNVPASTKLVLNIGDLTPEMTKELASAGVSGFYHVLRLREGEDTNLNREERIATIRNIKDAGLDWYYCCEPVGPEHTPDELVEQIFLGLEYECFQHAAMRRVRFPGSPIANRGEISELRLAQVVAVTTLAMIANPALEAIAVHEPNQLGLTSGANSIYAESGANPRDITEDTKIGRGRDTVQCCRMFEETGFASVYNAADSEFPLNSLAFSTY
ncbi:MAG: hypothetical protein ACRC2T_00435, partial [Thermoguttaceae bacterium]